MARNEQVDTLTSERLEFPYDRSDAKLSGELRIVSGNDSFVTFGGDLVKRPGTILITNTNLTKRIDRVWIVESLDTPALVYLLASAYNTSTARWEFYHNRLDGGAPGWVKATDLRAINYSTLPHEVAISRGRAYIKAYPYDIAAPSAPTVTPTGTPGATTWTYKIVAKVDTDVLSAAGSAGTTASGNATLNGANYNALSWTAVTGATAYDIYRTAAGGTPSTTGKIASTASTTYNDQGAAGDSAAAPTVKAGGLGSVLFDPNGGSPFYTFWGVLGPAIAARIVSQGSWAASAHAVTVRSGWKYVYAFKTRSGHVSTRSPLETNPDLNSSSTGAFTNKNPRVTVQGHADTTNVPKLIIYRTTDGGGTFTFLEEITNTGAGAITYIDDGLESGAGGGTFDDPVPDTVLDFAIDNLGPTEFSNSPPPSVTTPEIVGIDSPSPSTRPVTYAGRIWFAIGNILFFSTQEEITQGIPEEAFPSGLRGNFFRFPYSIVSLEATQDFLYVFSLQDTYIIGGSNKDTFAARVLLAGIGGAEGHPTAVTVVGESVVALTHDYRIGQIQGNDFRTLSTPLGSDIKDAIEAGAEIGVTRWASLDKAWIVVAAFRPSDTTTSRVWVYDTQKAREAKHDFWNTPWRIRCTAMTSGRVGELSTTSDRRLIFAVWNGSAANLVYVDTTGVTGTDAVAAAADTNYGMKVTMGLLTVPAGNHVNALRKPALTPVVQDLTLDRTLYPGDTDPQARVYLDDLWTQPIALTPRDSPPRRSDSLGYKSTLYPVGITALRVAPEIEFPANGYRQEILAYSVGFLPEQGA